MQSNNTETNPELFEQHYQYQRAKRRRERFKVTAVIFMGLAIASAISIGYLYYVRLELSKQIPTAIRESIDFPVYLPGQSKFQSDENSFKYSNGILLFLVGSKDGSLTVAEQKMPADFDLSKFSTGEGLTETKELTVHGNKALIGKLRGLNIAMMATGQTIVTVTSPSSQPRSNLELFILSLQKT